MNQEVSRTSDIYYSEDSGRNRERNYRDIEDDEDPRPAKRKLHSGLTHEALSPF